MELTTEEVLEINAALHTLEESKDNFELRDPDTILQAAKIVIIFGHGLKKRNGVTMELVSAQNQGPSITGATEYGNVIVTEDEVDKKFVEKTYGFQKQRIGHYKMWKQSEEEIIFHHFWKSDLTTEEEDSPVTEYHITYDPSTLELEHFGYEIEVIRFRIGPLCWGKNMIEPIFGNGRRYSGSFLRVG